MKLRFAFGVALVTVLAAPGLAASQTTAPAFPVKLLKAVVPDHVDRNSTIYTQPFEPKSVVKTDDAITFPLKSHLIFASHPDVTVPSGTLLVEAVYDGKAVYCGAFRQKAPDMNGASDVGFCLLDSGKTGAFNSIAYLTPNPDTVLTAYEIHESGKKSVEWTPVHVAYETVPIDDSLTGAIRLDVKGGLPGSGRLYSKLIWPDRLNGSPASDTSPAVTIVWPGQNLDAAKNGVSLDDGVTLSPDLSASISRDGDGYALKWIKTMPDGNATMVMKAWTRVGMATSQYTYELMSLEAK